jgi:hypothetical protein
MTVRTYRTRRALSRGFGMAYALTTLAILSLTVMVASRMAGRTADANRMSDMRDEVVSQAHLIRSKLISCMVSYPAGDPSTLDVLPATPASGVPVSVLTCPGDPATDKSLWKPVDGIFAPRPLSGLSTWVFIHATPSTAASISISAVGGGNPTSAALNNAALRFGAQARVIGSTLTVDIAN